MLKDVYIYTHLHREKQSLLFPGHWHLMTILLLKII